MDIVEFAESFYGTKLCEWQKEYLRTLDKLYEQAKNGDVDIRFVMVPRRTGKMFTYFKLKELIPDGKTTHSKQ